MRRFVRARRAALGGLLATLTLAAACAAPAPRMIEERRLAMGSELHLTAFASDERRTRAAFAAAFAEVERLEGLLSTWRPTSDVSRLNAAAGGAAVPVHPDTRAVLHAAAQVSAWTDGKFDVTFGALAEVWRFDHDQDNRVPTAGEIAARLPRVDHRAVTLDDQRGTAALARADVRVHVGGIGKGYAVDQAVTILRAAGLTDFMVQAGGDLYVAGAAGTTPWRLGIQDPRGPANEPFATVELADATFSTSGDYERYFERDGVRYHHILDPDTGQPARGTRSVTIVTRQATWADGLSTGVFILGPQQGMALVERLPDVEAVIVTAENEVLVSSGLRDRVEVRRAPSP
jgi:FAD:protein FMN transferase